MLTPHRQKQFKTYRKVVKVKIETTEKEKGDK